MKPPLSPVLAHSAVRDSAKPQQISWVCALFLSAFPGLGHADTLTVGSAKGEPGSAVLLPFRFAKTHEIVGMQFDLTFPVAQFTTAELADATMVGDDSDPDGDGIANLAEYLGGTLPKRMDENKAPKPGLASAGEFTYLTLTWNQSRTATGALAEPQVSNDLTWWSSTGVTTAPTGTGDAQTAEWRATVESVATRQFLRLNFKRTSP